MATILWRGDAAAVAQVDTLTPANVEIGDIFTATIGPWTVSFTATAGTVANVTAGLTAAWNASTIAAFAEITATDSTTHVTLTADTAGKPFTVTSSATNGGAVNDQTLTRAEVTANAGPYVCAAANFENASSGARALPSNSDTVMFEGDTSDCLYALDALAAKTGLFVYVQPTFTGVIGLPEINSGGYAEYRPSYLAIDGGYVEIDAPLVGRIKITGQTSETTYVIRNTGAALESAVPAVLVKGANADNSLTLLRGSVGAGFFGGDTATFGAIRLGTSGDTADVATLTIGGSCDVDPCACTQQAGTMYVQNNMGTLTQTGGVAYVDGQYTLTTATIAGTLYYRSSGTLTTLTLRGGTFDARQDARTRTVTNANVYAGSTIKDPSGTVTWTNGIDIHGCGIPDVTIDVGKHFTLSKSAI